MADGSFKSWLLLKMNAPQGTQAPRPQDPQGMHLSCDKRDNHGDETHTARSSIDNA
jgi:hypothetical protein